MCALKTRTWTKKGCQKHILSVIRVGIPSQVSWHFNLYVMSLIVMKTYERIATLIEINLYEIMNETE